MKHYIIKDDSITPTNKDDAEVIAAKKWDRDIVYKWFEKDGESIFVVDYNKHRVTPLIRKELDKMHDFSWSKKQKFMMFILFVGCIFFGSQYVTQKAKIESLNQQIAFTKEQKKETESILPIPWEQKTEAKKNKEAQWINIEMDRDLKELKIGYNNLEQNYKLAQDSIQELQRKNQLNTSQCSLEKKEVELQAKQSQRPEMEIYKEIEAKFIKEKEKEYREISKLKYLRDAQRACKNYFDKNIAKNGN